MNPTASDVHVNAPLTNISVAYMQKAENFIAHRVFPKVPVMKQSDRYYVYTRADFNRREDTKRGDGAESSGSGYNVDNTPTYFCDVYAHHKDVSDRIRKNSDAAHDPDDAAARFVAQKLMIDKEADWANSYFKAGVWTGGDIAGVASSPNSSQAIHWDDQTSGTPIENVDTGKTAVLEATGMEPNTLVLGAHVYKALKNNPDIIDRIKYSGGVSPDRPAMVTPQLLAQLFGVDRVLVAKSIQNTAVEGATEASSFILGKHALLVYSAETPNLMEPSGGYTFTWDQYTGVTNDFGMAMSQFRMDARKSDRNEGEMCYDHKLVAADVGYFWSGIVT
jgi:hypothetical protein